MSPKGDLGMQIWRNSNGGWLSTESALYHHQVFSRPKLCGSHLFTIIHFASGRLTDIA